MSTLQQAKLRVHWAGEKVEKLKSAIKIAWKDAAEATAKETDSDAHNPYLLFRNNLHDEAIRLISEFVHHARAALDYIIFALALRDTGSEQDGTQFPINSTPEVFAKNRQTCLKHLTAEHFAMVEKFQPYNGFQSLLLLSRLSNLDKHREFIHVIFLGIASEIFGSEAETQTYTDRTRQMHVNRQYSFQILLDDRSGIEEALTNVLSQVIKVVDHFDGVLG